jgi:uncharacterized protein
VNNTQIPSVYNTQPTEFDEEIQRSFITRVYGWMTFGLLITAGAALATISVPGVLATIVSNQILFMGLILGEFALVVTLSAAARRLPAIAAGLLFCGYAVLNGVTLSILVLLYTQSSIAITFGITACMFGIMTLYGFTTQRDLTKMGSLMIMGLIGIILASLVNIYIKSSAIYWIVSYAGVVIFVGLTAYDTQKLKRMSLTLGEDGDVVQKASIIGALTLYLDFINLFIMLLRILGRRK